MLRLALSGFVILFSAGYVAILLFRPGYDFPREEELATAKGLPVKVQQDKSDSGSVVFYLSGDPRLYFYSHICGEGDEVAMRLAQTDAPVEVGFVPTPHIRKGSRTPYYDVFQIATPSYSHTYQQCEHNWTDGNRFLGILASGIVVLAALAWFRMAAAHSSRK
ncbi:MAG: hypothetical protein GC190_10840 [Alphaproteobacteria bacterium]|nr:hypothetical protein [Alphaproteobacteria bacterium]